MALLSATSPAKASFLALLFCLDEPQQNPLLALGAGGGRRHRRAGVRAGGAAQGLAPRAPLARDPPQLELRRGRAGRGRAGQGARPLLRHHEEEAAEEGSGPRARPAPVAGARVAGALLGAARTTGSAGKMDGSAPPCWPRGPGCSGRSKGTPPPGLQREATAARRALRPAGRRLRPHARLGAPVRPARGAQGPQRGPPPGPGAPASATPREPLRCRTPWLPPLPSLCSRAPGPLGPPAAAACALGPLLAAAVAAPPARRGPSAGGA
ncbi:transcription initiation factor TFIID subunit 4-like [Panicum virgatum]|uniref:transcription initiation factor TFIID subunit 4-like n=1 Tax=Panicum virgatum TaxID=38727 RepID=UPI0019D50FB5|nr:transcription initiation factor TFIID subunit 4-like [Panicum virgatum]